MLEENWKGMVWPASEEANRSPETGVAKDVLVRVGEASVATPTDFVRDPPSYIFLFLLIAHGRTFTRNCKDT